jgi:hypothetical protein
MHELLELCGVMLTPPFVEEVRPDSHEFSGVASLLCQTLDFEKCGVVDDAVSLLPESYKLVISIGDEAAKSELLPTVPRAVVAREVCDFLCHLGCCLPWFRSWLTSAPNVMAYPFQRSVGVSYSSVC